MSGSTESDDLVRVLSTPVGRVAKSPDEKRKARKRGSSHKHGRKRMSWMTAADDPTEPDSPKTKSFRKRNHEVDSPLKKILPMAGSPAITDESLPSPALESAAPASVSDDSGETTESCDLDTSSCGGARVPHSLSTSSAGSFFTSKSYEDFDEYSVCSSPRQKEHAAVLEALLANDFSTIIALLKSCADPTQGTALQPLFLVMDDGNILFRLYHRLCSEEMRTNFTAPLRESSSPPANFLRLSFATCPRSFLAAPIISLYQEIKDMDMSVPPDAFAESLISTCERRDWFGSILDQILYGILVLPAFIGTLVTITESCYSEFFSSEENRKKFPSYMTGFDVKRWALGAVVMLYYVCPSLISVSSLPGVKRKYIEKTERARVIIASILQKLASGSRFDDFHKYKNFNIFLDSWRQTYDSLCKRMWINVYAQGKDKGEPRKRQSRQSSSEGFAEVATFSQGKTDATLVDVIESQSPNLNKSTRRAVTPLDVPKGAPKGTPEQQNSPRGPEEIKVQRKGIQPQYMWRFTEEQLAVMENFFLNETDSPSDEQMAALHERIGSEGNGNISRNMVKMWFRDRRKSEEVGLVETNEEEVSSTSPSPSRAAQSPSRSASDPLDADSAVKRKKSVARLLFRSHKRNSHSPPSEARSDDSAGSPTMSLYNGQASGKLKAKPVLKYIGTHKDDILAILESMGQPSSLLVDLETALENA